MFVFADLSPFFITIKLAVVTTVVLLLIGTPIAWWLANTKSKVKPIIEALVALPLVLPPTVIGFYMLIIMGPTGSLGQFWVRVTGDALTFSFAGLVIASIIYSFPFVVQPLQSAFESVGKGLMEAASTLGAKPFEAFVTVAMPMAKRGFVTATVMGIAHTMGEFGVVLMVGGNIPDETRVISIAIYDHVETLNYGQAHMLSVLLLCFSFAAMLMLYMFNRRASSND